MKLAVEECAINHRYTIYPVQIVDDIYTLAVNFVHNGGLVMDPGILD
jgi:hypothetical protein